MGMIKDTEKLWNW